MKKVTIELFNEISDEIISHYIANDGEFIHLTTKLDALEKMGENDPEAMMAVYHCMLLLNIVRSIDQVFAENASDANKNRILIIKKNASNFIAQMAALGQTDETYDKLLLFKSAKTAADIIGRQYHFLAGSYDSDKLHVTLLPGFIALNAEIWFLQNQIKERVDTYEEFYKEECVSEGFSLGEYKDGVGELPDEIGGDDGVSDLPDEIGLPDTMPDKPKPYIPRQFKR